MMIGKFFKAALRSPTVYLALVWALIATIQSLVIHPEYLFHHLSESQYDHWEDFAILQADGVIRIVCLIGFFAMLISAIRTIRKPLDRHKTAILLSRILIAILYLFLFARDFEARRPTALLLCRQNLVFLSHAMRFYADQNQGFLPPDLEKLKEETECLNNNRFFRCFGRHRPNPEFSDYLYYGAGRRSDEKPPYPLLEDRPGNHPRGYRNVIFSDGAIKPIEAGDSGK